MAFNKRNDRRFDEFFGKDIRRTPEPERYGIDDDVYASDRAPAVPAGMRERSADRGRPSPVPGGRSEAVRRRFGSAYESGHTGRPDDGAGRRSVGKTAAHPEQSRIPRTREEWERRRGQTAERDDRRTGSYPDDFEFEYERNVGRTVKKVLLYSFAVLFICVVAAIALFLLRPTGGGEYFLSNGSLPKIENIRQTEAYRTGAWLDWEPVEKVAGYEILRKDEVTGEYIKVKTAYLSFALLTGLEPGSTESCIIRPFCRNGSGVYTEPEADEFLVKTKPGSAQLLGHKTASCDSVTLEWQPIAGADGYEVERHLGKWSGYEFCGRTSSAQITVNGLDASTEYVFRMRPYADIGTKKCYGGWSEKISTATSPLPVRELVQGETTDSGYLLSWSISSQVTGFELYHADEQTGEPTDLVGQCGNNYYEIAGLESVNFSSYLVRGFLRHDSGISYGEFSDMITAVTLPSKVTGVDQYTAEDGTYTISWQPAARSEGYELYALRCSTGEYELLGTVSEPSFTLTDLSQYAERYKVRAFVSLGDLKFFGSYSDHLLCHPYYYLSRRVTVDKETTAMRTGAGPDFELIRDLSRGTAARVFGEKSGTDGSRWFRVELSDGAAGWISREDVDITNTYKTLATREYTQDEPIVIYLSPSRQGGNPYIIGNTTEKEQMEAVGAVTHRILKEEYNCVVYTANPELDLRERAFEAMELGADIYFAIHSNATGTGDVHYGASSYYCGASGRSKRLGEAVVSELNAIAPKKCTLDKQMYSALESFGGVGYAEVRDPYNLGMVAILVETDFHDNELTAQWIMDNHEAIGRALANALADTFEIDKKN